MKIQNSNSANIPALRTEASTSGAVNGRTLQGGGTGSDLAQISSLSSLLSAGGAQTAAWAAKVTELSSAVASGRYQVDAGAVSDNLINEHIRAAA